MMRCRNWVVLAASVSASFWGCSPPEIVPVGPPGVEFTQRPLIPEGEEAEALGEARVAAAATKKTPGRLKAATRDVTIPLAIPTKTGEVKTTEGGVKYTTLKEGTGIQATGGRQVRVHYVGTLTDGTEFDSSVARGTPFSFNLGGGEVIAGWDEGVAGMKVGEKRRLTIPPDMAYGPQGQPPKIPANATLIFQVELMEVN